MTAADVFAPGSTALITGGASGIGRAIGKLCRQRGMKVLLADRNAEALEDAAKELKSLDGEASDVSTTVLDVSNLSKWQALKETVTKDFGSIELLVLNAGVGLRGSWGDSDYFRKVSGRPTSKKVKCR